MPTSFGSARHGNDDTISEVREASINLFVKRTSKSLNRVLALRLTDSDSQNEAGFQRTFKGVIPKASYMY